MVEIRIECPHCHNIIIAKIQAEVFAEDTMPTITFTDRISGLSKDKPKPKPIKDAPPD